LKGRELFWPGRDNSKGKKEAPLARKEGWLFGFEEGVPALERRALKAGGHYDF